jgi:hypothetical protein
VRAIKWTAAAAGIFLLFCVRGVLLWFFLVPGLLVWVVGLLVWPFAKVLGRNVPASLLFYSRWATALLDALLTRVLPFPDSPWPWHLDLRRERMSTWTDTFSGFGDC